MNESWLLALSDRLREPLPGRDAQMKMAPEVRRNTPPHVPYRKSGVMILLYPRNHSSHIVLIKRAEYKGVHSGQISLPGGIYESSDLSLQATAIRETSEETGIKSESISILGQLSPVYIPVSHTDVFPFVGACHFSPDFLPDPGEVQYLIETPLASLISTENYKNKKVVLNGISAGVPYIDILGHHVWGATAMILSEFVEILKSIHTAH